MSTITISPSISSGDTLGLLYATRASAASPPRHGVPISIPRGEVYYWTARWQADERESLEAIERGDVRRFDSDDPRDAIRWLLDDAE